jgi:hypothetical protein
MDFRNILKLLHYITCADKSFPRKMQQSHGMRQIVMRQNATFQSVCTDITVHLAKLALSVNRQFSSSVSVWFLTLPTSAWLF